MYKRFFEPLKINFFSLILFEFIYKALGNFLLFPYLLSVLRDRITGFGTSLITTDNIHLVFQTPANILVFLLCVVVLLYYFLIEITTLSAGLTSRKRLGIFQLVTQGLKHSLRYLTVNNWIAFLIIPVFIPILRIGLQSGIAELLYLRLYLGVYIDLTISTGMIVTALLLEVLLFISFSYVFIYFVKYNISMGEAVILIYKTFKDNFKKSLITIVKATFLTAVLILGITILFVFAGCFIYLLIMFFNESLYASNTTESYRSLLSVLTPLAVLLFSVINVFTPLFFFSGIVGLSFNHREKVGNSYPWLKTAALLIIFFTFSGLAGSAIASGISDDSLLIAQTGGIITAHRGNSLTHGESTYSAFKSAIENGAEYLEFDVQMTYDGVLVVNHDSTLNTVNGSYVINFSGFDGLAGLELVDPETYEPLGEDLLTLDELLDLCQRKVKLNIELKTQVLQTGIVEKVVEKIKERGLEDLCYLASSNYQYVLEIEEKYPELNTLFLTSSNYGDIENLAFDSLSLEQKAIDPETVQRLHLRGKMIQAWTLTSEEEIKKMIDMDVDFLIVNDVRTAQNVLANNRPTQLDQITDLLELILYNT